MSRISPYFALVLLALLSAPEILAEDYDVDFGGLGAHLAAGDHHPLRNAVTPMPIAKWSRQ
jgi:hypothetical protein